MKRTYVSAVLWSFAAILCILLLTTNAYAAEAVIEGINGGPGVCYDESGEVTAIEFEGQDTKDPKALPEDVVDDAAVPEADTISDAPAESSADAAEGSGAAAHVPNADDVEYEIDGIKYKKGEYWGSHKLTGYSGEEWGTDTASGAAAKAGHTVSATSQLPFGTVIIIDGGTGPSVDDYNGIYVVEDRGGSAIENEGVVDIFFDTHQEALMVTHYGWNRADIWIAEPVA